MTSISTGLFEYEILAQEGKNVPLLKALRPFQIVSLLDMIKFYAEFLHMVSSVIAEQYVKAGNLAILEHRLTPEKLEESRVNVLDTIRLVHRYCKIAGLDFTAMYIDKKLKDLEREFSERASAIFWQELNHYALKVHRLLLD